MATRKTTITQIVEKATADLPVTFRANSYPYKAGSVSKVRGKDAYRVIFDASSEATDEDRHRLLESPSVLKRRSDLEKRLTKWFRNVKLLGGCRGSHASYELS